MIVICSYLCFPPIFEGFKEAKSVTPFPKKSAITIVLFSFFAQLVTHVRDRIERSLS